MGTRKCILVSSVLVIWLVSGYSAHSLGSGRSAKILEEPIVPQASSYEVISSSASALQDPSDRSLSVENNMMLYRSVFTLSLKLLTVFLLCKLLTYGLTTAGIIRSSHHGAVPIVPYLGQAGQPNLLYTVDVNQNPAIALQGNAAYAGSTLIAGNGLSTTSTGAAAGASSGTAPLALAPVPASGYLTAGTNPRPNYLPPMAPPPAPRFRLFGFGGPRHPPPRRPPPLLAPQHYNLGEETHYVDTHSHLFVMPDGSQARVPISHTAAAVPQAKPATSNNSASTSDAQQDSKSSGSSKDDTTERAPVESVNVSTSSSSSPASAERRSSNVFSQKSSAYPQHVKNQPYDDWTHYKPGA